MGKVTSYNHSAKFIENVQNPTQNFELAIKLAGFRSALKIK